MANFHRDQAKKIQKGRFSKFPFFKIANSQNVFVKISWIGPLVIRIDWREVFLGCFCPYVGQPHSHIGWDKSMPFALINPSNPRTNPWNFHKKILRIGDFEKCTFFESAILIFFFSKRNCFISMQKSSLFIWGIIYFCNMVPSESWKLLHPN